MTDWLLTTREVAAFLGLSPETVLRRWRAGELPGYRLVAGPKRGPFDSPLPTPRMEPGGGLIGDREARETVRPSFHFCLERTRGWNHRLRARRIMGTSVSIVEAHYGALLDTAHESLLERLKVVTMSRKSHHSAPKRPHRRKDSGEDERVLSSRESGSVLRHELPTTCSKHSASQQAALPRSRRYATRSFSR
jgi:excisionase family DNA binding protein